jgi:hypothetical protein
MSTGSIGQTQIRMVTPSPRIGQTTIRPTGTPIRIQTPVATPRLTTTNITPIRAGQTIVQTTNNLNQIPALHPVSNTTILSGTTQVRLFFYLIRFLKFLWIFCGIFRV